MITTPPIRDPLRLYHRRVMLVSAHLHQLLLLLRLQQARLEHLVLTAQSRYLVLDLVELLAGG